MDLASITIIVIILINQLDSVTLASSHIRTFASKEREKKTAKLFEAKQIAGKTHRSTRATNQLRAAKIEKKVSARCSSNKLITYNCK